ncbi:hypothetical protein LR48_Vigan10g259800 [Vigna angularis]|uniref:Uncharacterized protein n=1 Tax=Phaseolus angularis TaxID=3914 RepID=A0A0L9VNR0_PHAAN|nr:hypothetical protein LR48_Vigan10g259800 [Vigna angularis]
MEGAAARSVEVVGKRLQVGSRYWKSCCKIWEKRGRAGHCNRGLKRQRRNTVRRLIQGLQGSLQEKPSPSLYCNSSPSSPITFQNRRNIPGDVSVILDRTKLGSELIKCKLLSEPEGRTLVEDELNLAFWAYTAIQEFFYLKRVPIENERPVKYYVERSAQPSDGGASLEEMLEEENLEDANMVEVEVKAEP